MPLPPLPASVSPSPSPPQSCSSSSSSGPSSTEEPRLFLGPHLVELPADIKYSSIIKGLVEGAAKQEWSCNTGGPLPPPPPFTSGQWSVTPPLPVPSSNKNVNFGWNCTMSYWLLCNNSLCLKAWVHLLNVQATYLCGVWCLCLTWYVSTPGTIFFLSSLVG